MQMTLSFNDEIAPAVPLASVRSSRHRAVPRSDHDRAVLLVDRPAPGGGMATQTKRIVSSAPAVSPVMPSREEEEEPERWDGLY